MSAVRHHLQPTRRTCGQTVCAMLAGVEPVDVIRDLGKGSTTGRRLIAWLRARGVTVADRVQRFRQGTDPLPEVAIVRVDWSTDRKRTHWILWADGRFWDPGTEDGLAWARRGGRLYSIIPVAARTPGTSGEAGGEGPGR